MGSMADLPIWGQWQAYRFGNLAGLPNWGQWRPTDLTLSPKSG